MDSTTTWNAKRLSDYFVLLRRQWLIVVLCLAIGLGAAAAYAYTAPPEYVARTAVLVSSTTAGVPDAVDRATTVNLDTEAQLVRSTEIVSAAAERLGAGDVGDLVDRVRVTVPPNTEILEIAFVGGSAREAQRGSLAFAEAYLEQRSAATATALQAEIAALQTRIDAVEEELARVLRDGAALPAGSPARARAEDRADVLNTQLAALASQQGQLRAATVSAGRIVTEPALPSSPSSPRLPVALVAGALLGLLVGVGVAALRQRSDDVLHTPDDLFRRTRVPVAAVLGGRLHPNAAAIVAPLSSDGRGYARLRNLVTSSLAESGRKVVLVAGVRSSGGPVAANLAASLARAGEDVHLVCADVFGNTERSLFGGEAGPGLAEALSGEIAVADAVRTLAGQPPLKVVGPGRDPDRADALLQTGSPRKLVDELLRSSSYVVIEAPATADSSDAQTLANVAEIAVLVVEAGETRAREVVDACAQLESMGTPVLGAVIARYDRTGRSAGPAAGDAATEALEGEAGAHRPLGAARTEETSTVTDADSTQRAESSTAPQAAVVAGDPARDESRNAVRTGSADLGGQPRP